MISNHFTTKTKKSEYLRGSNFLAAAAEYKSKEFVIIVMWKQDKT